MNFLSPIGRVKKLFDLLKKDGLIEDSRGVIGFAFGVTGYFYEEELEITAGGKRCALTDRDVTAHNGYDSVYVKEIGKIIAYRSKPTV